jgi:uncharacterized membrane protein YfcA
MIGASQITQATTAWLFMAAFGASALGGVLGMASGIFIVPILTLFFGVDMHVAIGASLISVIACSCGSAAPFIRRRLTNVRLAIVLETATVVGALSGVLLTGAVPARVLQFLFVAILLLSARQMLFRRRDLTCLPEPSSLATRLRLHSSFRDSVTGRDMAYQVGNVPLGLSFMYAAGLLSALLGIGSGVLKIPAMDTALRLPIKVSSATSNFMIGVTAAASACAYVARGDVNVAIAGPIALGSVVGALIGARLLMGLPAEKLRVFFVVVLIALAAEMLLSATGISRGAQG